jgi:hypothetical protein
LLKARACVPGADLALPPSSPLERAALTQAETYGRTRSRAATFGRAHEPNDSNVAAMTADGNAPESKTKDWADRVGERVSTIFIAALIALFAYAYLGPFVFR